MTGRRPNLLALAERLLRAVLPEEAATAVIGDLLEELANRAQRNASLGFPRLWLIARAAWYASLALGDRIWNRLTTDRVRPPNRNRTRSISMRGCFRDGRHAIRSLLRRPVFFATAVATLTIGIGVNAAMFSVVNRLLIKPLPYPDADRLVQLSETAPDLDTMDLSFPDFHAWRTETHTFASMAAFDDVRFVLASETAPERLEGAVVSADLLTVLGLSPSHGRFFTAVEEQPGQDAVVVLSHALWTQRFGSDPSILGRSLSLNGRSRTVIGVGPVGFRFPEIADLWVPLALNPMAADPDDFTYDVVARLKPGLDIDDAHAEGALVLRRLADERRVTRANVGVAVYRLRDADVSPELGWASVLLLCVVGAVLLMACMNLAVLVAARGMTRQAEIAIRTALGASRSRVLAHLTAESAVLTGLGATGGALLGSWLTGLVNAALPPERPFWMVAEIDRTVLAFVVLSAAISMIVVGVVPAWQTSRVAAHTRGARGGTTSFRRLQHVMVTGQVSASFALLVGAGVMLAGLRTLETQELGIDAAHVGTVTYQIPRWTLASGSPLNARHAEVLETVRAVPGVDVVGLISDLPVGAAGEEAAFAPVTQPEATTSLPVARVYVASSGVFQALGMSIIAGRTFDDQSSTGVVISEALARRFWPRSDAVGSRIHLGSLGARSPYLGSDAVAVEVLAVVNDVRRPGHPDDSRFVVYASHRAFPLERPTLVVRTAGSPLLQAAIVAARVRDVVSDAVVDAPRTLASAVQHSLQLQQLYSRGFTAFAAAALGLAAIGMWGIVAYAISLRRGEVAVRRALGASDTVIVRMLLRDSSASIGPGLLLGATIAWGLVRWLQASIPGLPSPGLTSPAIAAVVFISVALIATYVPTRRALTIEPSDALRAE